MTEQDIRDEAERRAREHCHPSLWTEDRHKSYYIGFTACAQWLLSQQGEGEGMECHICSDNSIKEYPTISCSLCRGFGINFTALPKDAARMKFLSPCNPPEVKENEKGIATGIPHGVTQSTPGSYPEGSPKWSAGVSPDSTSQPAPEKTAETVIKEKCQEIPSWFLPNEIIIEKWIESLKEQSQSSSLRDALIELLDVSVEVRDLLIDSAKGIISLNSRVYSDAIRKFDPIYHKAKALLTSHDNH